MRKFSWYTIIHPAWHPGEPPLFRLVGPAIEESGEVTCDIYFKPNRKGGYNRKENHLTNSIWRDIKRGIKWKHTRTL